jgi:hypothetical protein
MIERPAIFPKGQTKAEPGFHFRFKSGVRRDMLAFMKTLVAFLLSATLALAADISGKWSFNVVLDAGSGSPSFEFKQDGETLTGMYKGQFGEAKLTGTVKGDKVEFSFSSDAGTAKYSGTLEGAAKMKGTVDYGEACKGTFTAVKN